MRFENGRWEGLGRLPRAQDPFPLGCHSNDGPPWLLIDRGDHQLWRLDYGKQGEGPQIARVDVEDGGKKLQIHDAIPWTEGALLLATDAGLRAFAHASRTIARVGLPEPAGPATRLVRDGLGRLWQGGDRGLWLTEPEAKALDDLSGISGVGRGGIDGLALDPAHADGVILALGSRGVAFVRATRGP